MALIYWIADDFLVRFSCGRTDRLGIFDSVRIVRDYVHTEPSLDKSRSEYFDTTAEWSDELLETQEMVAEHTPELPHVIPAEAFVLGYMDPKTCGLVAELLNDNPPEKFNAEQA